MSQTDDSSQDNPFLPDDKTDKIKNSPTTLTDLQGMILVAWKEAIEEAQKLPPGEKIDIRDIKW